MALLWSVSATSQTLRVPTCLTSNWGNTDTQSVCGATYVQGSTSVPGASFQTTLAYDVVFRSPTTKNIDVNLSYVGKVLANEWSGCNWLGAHNCRPGGTAHAEVLVSVYQRETRLFWQYVDASVTGPRDTFESTTTSWLNELQTPAVLSLVTNQTYTVSAQMTASLSGPGEAFAWAYADPAFSIDAALYPDTTIVVSDGIQNRTTPSAIIEQLGDAAVAAAQPAWVGDARAAGNQGDAPLPLWSLAALGICLLGAVSYRLNRDRQAGR